VPASRPPVVTLLHGPAWPAWLAHGLVSASASIRIYAHRIAAPPSHINAPLAPIWTALVSAPRPGVTCQILTPVPSTGCSKPILNRAAALALAGAGWQFRYLPAFPSPACRLYLFDGAFGAIADYDLLNSHLTATHLHALALDDRDNTAPLERAFSALWLTGRCTT